MITTPGRISTIGALGVSVRVAFASVRFSPDGARGGIVVANGIRQPGTQPGEVGNLETPDECDNGVFATGADTESTVSKQAAATAQ